MSKTFKKDYLALQQSWYFSLLKYLDCMSVEEEVRVMDKWRDSLIDIDETGSKAIRDNYDKWEKDDWLPFCKSKLAEWIKANPFEARIEDNKVRELNSIKQDHNYMRFRKIMQVIQDGIGFGKGREREHYELSGFMGDSAD